MVQTALGVNPSQALQKPEAPPQRGFANICSLPAIKSQHYSGELSHAPYPLSPTEDASASPSPNTAEVKQKHPVSPSSSKPCVLGVLPPPQQHMGRPAFIYAKTKSRICSELHGMQSVHTKTERQFFSSRNSAQIKHGINTWTLSQ